MSDEEDQQFIARRFSELSPDLQKGSATVIAELGLPPWDELDPQKRRYVLQRVPQVERRRAANRYTLQEAARDIVRHVATRVFAYDQTMPKWLTHWHLEWQTLSKLIDAAKAGELPIFLADRPVRHPPDNKPLAEWFTRETYGHYLNRWLETHEPDLGFEFPAPRRDAGDAGVGAPADHDAASVAANTPSAETEPGAPVADPPNATSADERAAERVASQAKRGDQKDPLLFSPSLLLNRQAAALGVSVEELKAMLRSAGAPQIPASLRDALATDPSFRRSPGAEEVFRKAATAAPIASNAPVAAYTLEAQDKAARREQARKAALAMHANTPQAKAKREVIAFYEAHAAEIKEDGRPRFKRQADFVREMLKQHSGVVSDPGTIAKWIRESSVTVPHWRHRASTKKK
ncbi:hypothetical protein B2G74_22210 [Burkholderia sp. A27]|nr:hypothetical protein B2G74_22210 [Burkholderia sp. A27]